MQHGTPYLATERYRPLSIVEVVWELFAYHPEERASMLRPFIKKTWWLPLVAGVWLYVGITVSAPTYEHWGLSATAAACLAGGLLVWAGMPLAIILGTAMSQAYSRMRPPDSLLVVAAVPGAVYVCALLNTSFGVWLPAAVVLAIAFTTPIFLHIRSAVAKIPGPVSAPIWLDNPASAELLVAECEQQLAGNALTDDERAAVEANLASGLAVLATHTEHDDELPRAYELLARSLESVEPLDAYLGGALLVEAMAVKASRTGDLEGYEDAVQLMFDAAAIFAVLGPSTLPRALLIRATHLAALSRRADDDGQPGRAARLHGEALDALLLALERSSARRTVHLLARVKFASLVDRDGDDLDAAIHVCRGALRYLRLRSRLKRDTARLVLCDLLADRAGVDPARAEHDLAEATRLCDRLHRHPASRLAAARRLPGLLRRGGADAGAVGRAYRQAFAELSQTTGAGASEVAAEWSAWAAQREDADEAAQAHESWLRALADDVRRRPLRAEKERRLARVQGITAATGAWLVQAGRARDAAVAVDLGRAMLLTERMHRGRADIADRLDAAGHEELAARWRTARERILQTDREAFTRGRSAPAMLVAGRRFQPRFTSTDHLALAEHEELLREIGALPEFRDVDAPLGYDELRAAASDGPLVYVFATDERGWALIVTGEPEPEVVELPQLTAPAAEQRADRLLKATDAHEVAEELEQTLPWLWSAVMEPLAGRLPTPALVTLVGVGALGELPLNTACPRPASDANGVWHSATDGLVFRFAPNARVLRRAAGAARGFAGEEELRALTAAVTHAPGAAELPLANLESRAVQALLGADRTERPVPATVSDVLAALERCAIWHFSCHGRANAGEPLDSALLLADGHLTLRRIFGRPTGRQRLAVLSACHSAAPDRALLDEVVSFPSALLQAGVAGVVSSHAVVIDRAAMLLVLCFFHRLVAGAAAPAALAQAQAWLRGATNEQLHAAFPGVHPVPADRSGQRLDRWQVAQPFTEPYAWATFSYSGA